MATTALSELVEFSGTADGTPVTMTIFAPSGAQAALQRLTAAEAAEHGEEPVQLLEGLRYEFELSSSRYVLVEESGVGVVQRSANPHLGHCGTLVTGLSTGKLALLVTTVTGEAVGTATLEIRPKKFGHRDHYKRMLEDITDVCVGLAMELRAPVNMQASPSPGSTSQTIHQRFAFVKALINSTAFKNALHRISTHPHKRWEAEERIIDVRKGFRSNAKTMREIAKAPRRVATPFAHPLSRILPTIPERIPTFKNSQTEDTKENQFIQFAMETFASFLRSMQRKLGELAVESKRRGVVASEADKRLSAQISNLEGRLLHALSADVFQNLSKLTILPLGSPVLQRKEGYREIFQAWLKFDLAARLVWHNGDDVYSAGQRDIATLYEYWVFFKLLNLVGEFFRFSAPASSVLMEETSDGFGVKLKSGEHLAFDATYETGGRKLRVQFGYNRTFGGNSHHEASGSWTERMRPDYTLSLWPSALGCDSTQELSAKEAEKQDLMVHLHFDAKYRVDNLEELFGKESESSASDVLEPSRGRHKRDDLLKMHAYRDAIRRTHGAYILYPGDTEKGWEQYREILPGLGAFPLRPGSGEEALRSFIDDVVRHVCDRATQREQISFHAHRVRAAPRRPQISIAMHEIDPVTTQRIRPLAETLVLVSPDLGEAQYRWTLATDLFALRLGAVSELANLDPRAFSATYVLVCSDDQRERTGLLKAVKGSPQIVIGQALHEKGYADASGTDFYVLYECENAPEFGKCHINPEQRSSPGFLTLDQLLSLSE